MSEGNVPSRSHDTDPLAATASQLPLPSDGQSDNDDWETVAIVGMPPLSTAMPSEPLSDSETTSTQHETVDLQARVADLGQCNDVLVARVHQLEEALERSQQALQQEVERSQRLTEEDKLAAAQTRSVAQLLSELEAANAALKRQTLLAATLSAQLKTAEERAQRLEQECSILRKRKTERAKELQLAEDTCADLRSRLQRQQQYTLQFKSALEKCLDTTAFQHTSHSIENGLPHSDETATDALMASSPTVVMPRSESIRPWSANSAQVSADPQLRALLSPPMADALTRESATPPTNPTSSDTPANPVNATVSAPIATAATEAAPQAALDNVAEQQLWQDVERVIEKTVTDSSSAASDHSDHKLGAPEAESPDAIAPENAAPTAEFTEPIPWGTPANAASTALPDADEEDSAPTAMSEPAMAAAVLETSTADCEKPFEMTPQSNTEVPSVPALEAMQTASSSPSPLVHPLRPSQRKRKSLSAVELPNFPPLPRVPTD